ncbi:MAG: right-handed parallel beta-helix repeat-containing protein, partial [Pirellulales bacterium]|nr:right-handed parallel beta-helix repeat-containing protein [Pirellulales bacterium]
MRTLPCLLPNERILAAASVALVFASAMTPICAQDGDIVPASAQRSGSFFSRQLGTALRFDYRTQGYGTQDDVISIGGMKVFNQEGATWFLDGQGTLSNDFGGGFNLGVGYRQLTTSNSPLMSYDPQRILGAGFWTDGQSTAADNFFTQLGFTLESLGDSVDMRLNGSFPLTRTMTGDPMLITAGAPFFSGNEIFGSTEVVTIDTAHTVVDGELAKRINDLEAWAYIGGYQLGGGDVDATGYRVGMRGYAVPDLALSLQVTDDDVYATNVVFGITWFVGRTNRSNSPCGTICDRFREPVLRNNFIAITSAQEVQGTGDPLTIQGTTDPFDIVHVDSTAAAGGDGTFENPFQLLTEVDDVPGTTSRDNSIILVHGGSSFTGAEGQITLQEGQQLLGEGLDSDGNAIAHIIDPNEFPTLALPETAPGAQMLSRADIDATGTVGALISLANDNTVNNLTIRNAQTGVLGNAVNAPNLANLDITDATMEGVSLTDITGTTVVENTVNITGAGGTALLIDGGMDTMGLAASITNSAGRSLVIQDRLGGTVTYSGTIADMGGAGILIDNNQDSTINLTNTATVDAGGNPIDNGIEINTGAGDAITITGNSATPTSNTTINF